jgi:hypothetical protein
VSTLPKTRPNCPRQPDDPRRINGASHLGTQVTINVPASTTVAYWGIWTAVTAGTYVDGGALPSSETYGSAGTYLLTPTYTAS